MQVSTYGTEADCDNAYNWQYRPLNILVSGLSYRPDTFIRFVAARGHPGFHTDIVPRRPDPCEGHARKFIRR